VFKTEGEKSPEGVAECRDAEEDDGKPKGDLVSELRGVVALLFL